MMTMQARLRFDCSIIVFAAAVSLFHLVFFQNALFSYALGTMTAGENKLLLIVSLQILQFCLLFSTVLFFATFSVIVTKLLLSLLFMLDAAAIYFMGSYGVELDLTMISNILTTDGQQAVDLFHWKFFAYLFAFGCVPVIVIWAARIRKSRWFTPLIGAVASFAMLLAFLFATASTWLWYDAYGTRLGGRILPWSYIVNTARYFGQQNMTNRAQVLLPEAHFLTEPDGQKDIVVLVIGEAARADSFSSYGYDRDTMPFTKGLGLITLPVGHACATYTLGSLACISTYEGRNATARTVQEPIFSYLTRHGVETLYRSPYAQNRDSTPPFHVTQYERGQDIGATCTGDDCPDPYLDEVLNWNLGTLLTQSDASRIFVTLHQSGSHGPRYSTKYPAEFEHFKPVCDTVQVINCSRQELFNAYDNTIRYTDFLLADLMTQLSAVPDARVAMLYVSDHGQSLGEKGLFLHGMPNAVAPEVQRRVPFFVWMSDAFQDYHGLTADDVTPDVTHPHDFPFHSVMGALGMRSDIYRSEYDIFSDAHWAQ